MPDHLRVLKFVAAGAGGLADDPWVDVAVLGDPLAPPVWVDEAGESIEGWPAGCGG